MVNKKEVIFGQVPDLIFSKDGMPYIVEVQIGNLDKLHLYKSLEYRDFYFAKHGVKPKVILACEHIRDKHKPLLKIHKLQILVIKITNKN